LILPQTESEMYVSFFISDKQLFNTGENFGEEGDEEFEEANKMRLEMVSVIKKVLDC